MARDQCVDCKEDFPGGEGLVEGRCPACLALFEERRAEALVGPEPTEERGGRGRWPPGRTAPEPAAEEAEEEQ